MLQGFPMTQSPIQKCILLTFTVCILHLGVSLSPAQENEPESFTVNGTRYEIPQPWSGNRIHAPNPEDMKFGRIPVEHVKDNGKIYITETTLKALLVMLEAAERDGIHLVVESGYRSYGYQKRIFVKMLNQGRSYDDIIRYVAPPGYSQHAFGTALDFFPSNWRFADNGAYTWLLSNANGFGFHQTYPENNNLGYPWEPWHWNYTAGQGHAETEEKNISTD